MRQRDASGRVTSSIVAAVSVVVIAAALVAFMLGGSPDDTSAASDSPSASPSSPETTAGDPQSATTPSDTASSVGPKKDKARPKKPKQQRPTVEPEPVVPEVYVEVYNMTSVSGLAGSTAARLQDAGWQVVGIDNWRGNIPASTVYYPDGMADEADQLADTLGIGRVRGAVAPMKFDRLTVILTADAA